jgi:membrane fusion protein, multidrug efflux system
MRRLLFIVVGTFALAVGAAAYFGWKPGLGSRAAVTKEAPAVPVTVAEVATKTVPVGLHAVGNVEPYTTVALKARVDGQIVAVKFKDGDEVRQGDILFQIDRRPFEAQILQAEANMRKDKALLAQAVQQEQRNKALLEQKFISPDGYDLVRTAAEAAAATVHADEAAIDALKLQLDYCTIRAPMTGNAGKIMFQQGNLVKANDTNPLVVINQIVPIYVTFAVPEQDLPDVRRYQADGKLQAAAGVVGSKTLSVGTLSFIDNTTDVSTGTIKLKAEFPNRDRALWPGQFVNVVLTITQQSDAIVTPSIAVQNGPNGQYVFVVKDDQTVELRDVKVARTEGDDAVIASGLRPGERVVTVGQLRLAPGIKVTIDAKKPA